MKTYRDNGAIGALLDEYEKAYLELDVLISSVSPSQLIEIVDPHTEDQDCRSIQTILSHVIQAGYTYVVETRKSLGEQVDYYSPGLLNSIPEYQTALKRMFEYNLALFADHPNIQLEHYNPNEKFTVRWGQLYDVEQIMEHAIVHILRHRRQIERFLLKM